MNRFDEERRNWTPTPTEDTDPTPPHGTRRPIPHPDDIAAGWKAGPTRFAMTPHPAEPAAVELLGRVTAAGDRLALAAARVCAEYDGIHRLRAALAEWFTLRSTRGDEPTS